MKVEFFKHNINKQDIKNVNKVLRSTILTTGDVVEEFESKFASYLSMDNVIGVTSCTAALHLCLVAWGIGKDDEVITTPMSFCATSNAILHAGATPVFVDVEEDTGLINAELIEDAITSKTKAIIPVHLYGQMCDMKKIGQIVDKHNLVVIEDAAHCIEGRRDDIKVGHLSDAACFSFYTTKSITCGSGGAIATNNPWLAKRLKLLRLHGINEQRDMEVFGYKYNMNNIQAALLIGQVDRLYKLWEARYIIWRKYEDALGNMQKMKISKVYNSTLHAKHLFTILVNPNIRSKLIQHLNKHGIGTGIHYEPIHLLSYYRDEFRYNRNDFPVAEDIGARTISLPLYPLLKDKEIDYVTSTIQRFYDEK